MAESSTNPKGFLDLPGEIRVCIYEAIAEDVLSTVLCSAYDGLYLSCRTIRNEMDVEVAEKKVKRYLEDQTTELTDVAIDIPTSFSKIRHLKVRVPLITIHIYCWYSSEERELQRLDIWRLLRLIHLHFDSVELKTDTCTDEELLGLMGPPYLVRASDINQSHRTQMGYWVRKSMWVDLDTPLNTRVFIVSVDGIDCRPPKLSNWKCTLIKGDMRDWPTNTIYAKTNEVKIIMRSRTYQQSGFTGAMAHHLQARRVEESSHKQAFSAMYLTA